jgi:two-component system phosphate regulon sensor histidine kinase PhoR
VDATYRDHALSGYVGLSVHVDDLTPAVLGDPAMIEQLLDNLVSNAIKYTPAGGEVEVSAASAGAFVRLEVRDNGIGIPVDEQPALFGEFYRATNARQIAAVGTGLGLAIVKQIVDQHSGRIALESAEGCGTRIVVDLPVA